MWDTVRYYLLVDVGSGRVIDRCVPSADAWGPPPLGLQLPSHIGVRSTSDQDGTWWWGALRPGGPAGHTVLGPHGVIDLASGRRTPISIPGYVPAAVGRTAVIMMRARSAPDGIPSVRAADWCVTPLVRPTTCAAVPEASGPGTPAVAPDGAIVWLSNELTRSAARVPATPDDYFYLRIGHGMVTAEGGIGAKRTDRPFVLPDRVAPDGRAFVVMAPPRSMTSTTLAATAPITWYTVALDGTQTRYQAAANWPAVAAALGATPFDVARGDIAVSPDGRTLYVLLTEPGTATSIVAVSAGGRPEVLGTAEYDLGDASIDVHTHFLTVPTTAS
jgi:hypothetical protein